MANALAPTKTSTDRAQEHAAQQQRAVAASQSEAKTFRDLIAQDNYKRELAKIVGPEGVERVVKLIIATLNKKPDLLQCTAMSVYQAVVECATLNLWPGPQGHTYFISRNNKVKEGGRERWESQCEFTIGYRGMIELAYRSNVIVPGSFVAQPVYENDDFDFAYGSKAFIEHKPTMRDRGKLVGFYALCQPKDAAICFDVMRLDEVEAVRQRSKAKDSGPWVTDYNAMGCKTVLRRFWKKLPSSVVDKYADALERDMEREFDLKEVEGAVAATESRPAKMREIPGASPAAAAVEHTPAQDELAAVKDAQQAEPAPAPAAEPQQAAARPAPAAPPVNASVEDARTLARRVIEDLGDDQAGDVIDPILRKYRVERISDLRTIDAPAFIAELRQAYDTKTGRA